MILIADSGSTKTDWALVTPEGDRSHYFTEGINPFFQSESEIEALMRNRLLPQLPTNKITRICFYGAGCATEKQISVVKSAFSNVLSFDSIAVASDLLGAARALCGNKPGIACILGTGSNSCYYNGQTIEQQVSPLGFILGDEGSGAALGKRLVADCLKNQLSKELKDKFLSQFGLTPTEIVENVYRKPFPNRFLASLSPFLKENISEQSIYTIVYEGFADFFKKNVCQYDYKQNQVYVVGSIGFYYQDILQKAAADLSVNLANIIQSPVEGLVHYHTGK